MLVEDIKTLAVDLPGGNENGVVEPGNVSVGLAINALRPRAGTHNSLSARFSSPRQHGPVRT